MHDFYIVFEAKGGVMGFREIGAIGGAMALVVTAPGCSFIFTRGPGPTPPPEEQLEVSAKPPADCTTSNTAPALDTAMVALSSLLIVGGAVGMAQSSGSCGSDSWGCGVGQGMANVGGMGLIAVGTVLGAVYTASAITGFNRTAACRAARQPVEAPAADTSGLLPSPGRSCPKDDAPRLCRSVTSLATGEKSALAAGGLEER